MNTVREFQTSEKTECFLKEKRETMKFPRKIMYHYVMWNDAVEVQIVAMTLWILVSGDQSCSRLNYPIICGGPRR